MIRLYPNVVKSEENISDMRRLLGSIVSESHHEADELSDTTTHIRELGAKLGRAEMEHRKLNADFQEALVVARERHALMQAELSARARLADSLTVAEAQSEARLEALASSEWESKRRWDVILERRARLSELGEGLGRLHAEHGAQETHLEAADARRQTLFGEYRQAEHLAADRRDMLREEATAAARDSDSAASLEAEARELSRQVGRLLDTIAALEARLAPVKREIDEHEGLERELTEVVEAREVLRQSLKDLEVQLEEEQEEREGLLQNVDNIRESIVGEERDVEELKVSLQESEGQMSALHSSVEEAAALADKAREALKEEEAVAQRLELELRAAHRKSKDEAALCKHKASDVERDIQRLKNSIVTDRKDAANTTAFSEELYRDVQRLAARNKEAQRQLQIEKKRCRCSIM